MTESEKDTYRTITTDGESVYTESRSRFLAFAHHVDTEEKAKQILAGYRKRYYDARHVCFAYVLGNTADITRQSDDGEPAGTAGAPIARQLKSFDVTYSLLVVVRYFGGVKLGTSRLGVAYKTAAMEALEASVIEEKVLTNRFVISVPYAEADVAMRYVRDGGASIVARDYTATHNVLTIDVRLKDEEALRQRLSTIFTLQFVETE